jgi:hypothetical protein
LNHSSIDHAASIDRSRSNNLPYFFTSPNSPKRLSTEIHPN